jgi:NTP pyrophosphatase (non-canonical NTP hydrolase)
MFIEQFEKVRQWKKIRGVGGKAGEPLMNRLQSQYQRVMQEVVEIHEAMVDNDDDEFQDAIGDAIVTLINLADIADYKAEDCLEKAFNVIKLRKGITREVGDFVRYGKLSDEDKLLCDEKQGSPGSEYFNELELDKLEPENFKR